MDYPKIDGNFVRDMATDPGDHAMVEAINRLGHVMGIKTIAEYVESPAILERLRALGVDYAQGYAISWPAPIADVLGMSDTVERLLSNGGQGEDPGKPAIAAAVPVIRQATWPDKAID